MLTQVVTQKWTPALTSTRLSYIEANKRGARLKLEWVSRFALRAKKILVNRGFVLVRPLL